MKVLVLLLVAFAVCALAQTPPRPIWPNGWSATVRVHKSHERHPSFWRWFWDKSQNKDRLDGIVEWKDEFYMSETIFDHPAGKMYRIYYQPGAVNCFDHALNSSVLPKPDFNRFTYVGKALVAYEPAFHWVYEDKLRGIMVALYDRQDNREILRIDIDDHIRHRAESWIFLEYDVGPQGQEMFQIPQAIMDQCNDF